MKTLAALINTFALIAVLALPQLLYAVGLQGMGSSDTPGFAVGTLASAGSFELATAAGYTKLAVLRHQAQAALIRGAITVKQAQVVETATQDALNTFDQAATACGQDPHTGKCTRDKRRANDLLKQGYALLAKIHVGDSP